MISKITEFSVFESPDGGETVYVRTNGSKTRQLYSESEKVKQLKKDLNDNTLWNDIRTAAKEDSVLQDALNRVIVLYHLRHNNGRSKTK